jgi:hypothetical protein
MVRGTYSISEVVIEERGLKEGTITERASLGQKLEGMEFRTLVGKPGMDKCFHFL